MKVVIVCDDASVTDAFKDRGTFEDTVHLNQYGSNPNLRQVITNITHRIVEDLDPKARDLLDIAAYVYAADGAVKRGTEKDVFAKKWKRDFTFALPVRDLSFWNSPGIARQLEEILSFLTGDSFHFFFSERKGIPEQLQFNFPPSPPPFPGADCICLFSGGLDSLAGAVYLCLAKEKHPILVSHRSSPKLNARQKRLVELLNERIQDWKFPHLSMWVNREGNRAVEYTQRSRSFLYLSIAVAVANQLNIGEIAMCENGVVSFNLPKSGQNVGTFLSRTTHPRFLADFQQLADSVFSRNITISNPFIFKTKNEVVETLTGTDCEELIQETVSCVHIEGTTKMQPHCGTCSQCVDRRFAIAAAGCEKFDLAELYAKDFFTGALEEEAETTYCENYVRFAIKIDEMDDRQFFAKFGELMDCIPFLPGTADQVGENIYELFKRHSEQVLSVIKEKANEYHDDLIRGKLPPSCLISMLGKGNHLQEPLEKYAMKIKRLLTRSIRIAFQSRKPQSEKDVQEEGEAALAAAGEKLDRESPMLCYSLVQTKPDFSTVDNNLFIEMKFLNRREKLNAIVTQISSRITIYRDQGAHVLFVVYDAADIISDDEKFVQDFEKHDGIYVVVIR
jgi:7-cyano-7-deazaguanine synthase in queuosine biosynthesis